MQFIRKIFRPRFLLPLSLLTSSALFYPHFSLDHLKKIKNEEKLKEKQGIEEAKLEESIFDEKNIENSNKKEINENQQKTNESTVKQRKINEDEKEEKLLDNQKRFISSLISLNFDTDRLIIDENPKGELLSEYSSARHSYHEGVCPMVAFYPINTDEVAKVMKLCFEYNFPVIGCGSGTNLEGSIIPSSRGVMIDFSQMNEIKTIYKEDFQVIVEPGVQWMELNKQLEKYNLFFPMDPGPGASIGGMINTNCSGTNAVRYGTMKDWIVNLTVVLADGRIIKTANRPKKSSAGYNLNSLFCGSEGTLGLVTEATIKVAPLEREFSVFSIAFEEIEQAIRSSIEIIQAGVNPSCLEFMDDQQAKAINLSSETYKLAEKQNLFIKVNGTDLSRMETINKIMEITTKNGGSNPQYAMNKSEAEILWNLRKKALLFTNKLKANSRIYITDVCVPISKLGISIAEAKKLIEEYNLLATIVGHVGDGNYHLFVVVDPTKKEEMEKIKEMHEKLVINAINLEGTCTGEHGIGMGKRKFLLIEKSSETIELMKQIKQTLDPKGLLNQGKIFVD